LHLNEQNIDVVCITEHWVKSDIIERLNISNYNVCASYCRKEFNHGGVLIAVKNKLKIKDHEYIEKMSIEKIIEMACIEVPSKNTIIMVIYRVPDSSMEDTMNKLSEVLEKIATNNPRKTIVVAGDFNIDLCKSSN